MLYLKYVLLFFLSKNHLFFLSKLTQASFDCSTLSLVAGLVEQSEHILLVCLYTRLVEWVNTQHVSADTTSNLEEVDELSDVVLVQLRNADAHVGHTTIHVSQLCTQLSHLVHLVNTLASQEVQSVQILLV